MNIEHHTSWYEPFTSNETAGHFDPSFFAWNESCSHSAHIEQKCYFRSRSNRSSSFRDQRQEFVKDNFEFSQTDNPKLLPTGWDTNIKCRPDLTTSDKLHPQARKRPFESILLQPTFSQLCNDPVDASETDVNYCGVSKFLFIIYCYSIAFLYGCYWCKI